MTEPNYVYNFSSTGALQQTLRPLKKLVEDTTLDKVMPDGKILEPIKVFEEGEYVTSSRNGKMVKFKATKERMEKWVKNAYRDVPFNIDHVKESISEIGWLRTASSNTFVKQDEATGKYALYTQPEFTQEAYDKYIARGRYRDVSLEIDPENDYITGIALTNYPRLKTLTQMSELADLDKPLEVEVIPEVTEIIEETQFNNIEVEMNIDEIKAQVEAEIADKIKAEYEAQFSVLKEQLDEIRAAKEREERDAANARLLLEITQKVDRLILTEDGKSLIPAGSKDTAVQLFCSLADNDQVVLFSEVDGETVETQGSKIDLVIELLKAQAAMSEVMQRSPLNNQTDIDRKVNTSIDDERPGVADALRNIYRNSMKQ